MTETVFSDLRSRVADALDDPSSSLLADAAILPDVVDSLTPPAFLLTWGNPWSVPATFCTHTVRLDVVCIAARIEPAPGVSTLEEMVAVALNRLRAAGLPEATVQPPARYDVGGIPYLAARISLEARIAIPLPEVAPTQSGAAQLVANAVLTATGASAAFSVKSGAVSLAVTATLTATGATGAYPTSTATATLSTTGALTATGATAAWPRVSGAALLATTPTLTATGAITTPWSPASIPGITAWYDASDLATITASAGAVSQWADKATAGNLVQAIAGKQPRTGTRTVAGKNALDFDGVNHSLALPALAAGTLAQPNTILVVISADRLANDVFFDGYGATNRHNLAFTTGTYQYYAGTVVNAGTAATGAQQWVCAFNGASSQLWVNGASITTANPGPDPIIGLSVGAYRDGIAALYDGAIAEIVVVHGVLSAGDRASWNAYTLAKWGV